MVRSRIRAGNRAPDIPGAQRRHTNLLLGALPGPDRRRLIAGCKPVELPFGEVLCAQGDRIRHVYFPTGGFISLIAFVDERRGLEVGLVGIEGMLGASLQLGASAAPLQALVQGAGPALRMGAEQFALELGRSPALRQVLDSYLAVLMTQWAQTAACARYHRVEARLARWLLMTRDRAQANEFHLAQEFMACMLGVRRAGINRAAGALQKRRLIRYTRGSISILNERGLEAASCGCYVTGRDVYTRLMR